MNKIIYILSMLTLLISPYVHARKMTFPAIAGSPAPDYATNCNFDNSGRVTAFYGTDCILYFSIPITAGSILEGVDIYYDGSWIAALLNKYNLSGSLSTDLDGDSDFYNIGTMSLGYGEEMSSSYSYGVYVLLSNETSLHSIVIEYE